MTATAPGVRMSTAKTPGRPPVHTALVLVIICVSYFMVILDNSIVFTALPQIRTAMGFSETGLSWITNAYVLVFGGLLLLGARAGDLFGHRKVFLFSLVVFSLTSLLVGAAPAQWWLIGARALQGVGAAVLAPSALSLLTRSFTEGRARNRAMAAYSAVAGLGAALGLVVGGLAADLISWRAGFFLNMPVGAVMMVMALRFLPETEPRGGRFDVAGALLATGGSTALVLGIVDAADDGWTAPATLIPLAAGVVLLVLFVVAERRAAQPIVPLRLFASRERAGAYVTRMLYMGAMLGFFFFTAQFVQSVYHWTPLQAGLAFLPMTLVNFVLAVQVPRILERAGRPLVLLSGVALTAAGMAWLSRLTQHTPYLTGIALPMVLIGAGQGLALAPLTSSGVDGVAPEDAGAGAGLVNTVHQIGSALALSILTAVAATMATGHTAADIAARSGAALTGSAVLLALALATVLGLIVPARAVHNERTL
ncbi:EmrB/QacA subfamily drug resistance transporter [Streptomyces sp. KhCrAH-43]|uniref:MFS transporter n=1 Tax=unclassified Streptomyces TaxID=2593676 RepID=UPI0003808D9E|nr:MULTISPECIES: MFS transporter [unclassified Streptomyces]MYS36756.1 DHA2 family efflux MFS transporter permease subunit [Streptomyces sp. SID4920]MYX69227.1 DHA2 family efflux MFS transporter permease subunit [Streptomyces sp. SID8373]RAJ62077.1 EmrB/QacA subfamily drug resistance transporter [Streptomyces sp. KhCrAH-43]